jgi:hypothetical protein
MRKLIIAFGIIGIIAAFGVQGWAAENPLYGCAQGKGGEVRAVNSPSDCLASETVVAMNQTDTERSSTQKEPEDSQKKTKKLPSGPWGMLFGHGPVTSGP